MKKTYKLFALVIFVSLVVLSFTQTSFAEGEAPALEVIDLQIARDIFEREPVDPGDTFTSDVHKLYCYSKVKVDVDASVIYHSWYFNDEKVTQIELNVRKSPGFRTYSSKTIMPSQTGKWEVEVQDSEGNVLQSITFTIN